MSNVYLLTTACTLADAQVEFVKIHFFIKKNNNKIILLLFFH